MAARVRPTAATVPARRAAAASATARSTIEMTWPPASSAIAVRSAPASNVTSRSSSSWRPVLMRPRVPDAPRRASACPAIMPRMPVDFLFLSQDDVVAAGGTDMPAVIDVIEGAFRLKAEGQVINPNKVMLTWSDEPGTQELHGRIMAMPAWVGGEWDVAGLKWIPSVPANVGRGLPRANAIVLLSDRETGLPVAVLDGTVISAMRTGAVTGVAIRHLARAGARTAGLLGAGVLTRTQLMALAATRPELEVARVYDPNTARTEALLAELAPTLPFAVAVAHSEREACEGADIIIPSTLAVTPTIAKEWVPAGGLVVLVSSLDGPEDLHDVTDLLVVDDRDHEGTADTRYLRRLRDAASPRPTTPSTWRRSSPGSTRAARARSSASSARPWASAWTTSSPPPTCCATRRSAASARRCACARIRSGCRDTPAMAPKAEHAEVEVSGRTVSISSPDKLFFKERGETKLDLVRYVIAVGEPLLRAIGGPADPDGALPRRRLRQVVLPEAGAASAPDWLRDRTVATVNGTESDALVAVDVAHLVWAVNLGCLGFHAWPTLAAIPSTPTSCASTSTRARA